MYTQFIEVGHRYPEFGRDLDHSGDKMMYWWVRRGARRHTNARIVIMTVQRLWLRGKGPRCGAIELTSDPRRHWPFDHVAWPSSASDKLLSATKSTPCQIFYPPPAWLSTSCRERIVTVGLNLCAGITGGEVRCIWRFFFTTVPSRSFIRAPERANLGVIYSKNHTALGQA
jgi:hypothetical protein